jgi:hypothetical protein
LVLKHKTRCSDALTHKDDQVFGRESGYSSKVHIKMIYILYISEVYEYDFCFNIFHFSLNYKNEHLNGSIWINSSFSHTDIWFHRYKNGILI